MKVTASKSVIQSNGLLNNNPSQNSNAVSLSNMNKLPNMPRIPNMPNMAQGSVRKCSLTKIRGSNGLAALFDNVPTGTENRLDYPCIQARGFSYLQI